MAEAVGTTKRTRRKAATAAPVPAAAGAVQPPPPQPAPRTPVGKQALVIVHGIGEQRPLETIREFVETVYQRDPSLTADDPEFVAEELGPEKVNRAWIVPDPSAGSNELRRITTVQHFDHRRTDFYEFYWADLTSGTPFEMVRAWVQGLLIRSPFRIPNDIRIWWSWLILWVLTLAFIAGALLIAYPTAGPFEGWVRGFAGFLRWKANELGALFAFLGVVILVYRAFRTSPIRRIKLLLPVAFLVLSAVILFLAPTPIIADPRFWAAVATAAVGATIAGVIVPYVGDIVRYVRATPVTVASREAIRERGLKLLKDIHDKRNAKGEPEYDRVILVGHSLGCFVAYDLLQLFWAQAGPNARQDWKMTPEVAAGLAAADAHVAAYYPQGAKPRAFDPPGYWQAQKLLHRELVAAKQGWLISDFVTLGSPIVHSAFLTADDEVHLERSLDERMLSASPPRPDLPNNSMLIGETPKYPHHAAAFAAVHWTNIHDYAPFPLLGDVISGKVPEDRFGPGVTDYPVTIRRNRIPILGRLFTHTEYWTNTTGNWADPPDHIVKLREALNLMGK